MLKAVYLRDRAIREPGGKPLGTRTGRVSSDAAAAIERCTEAGIEVVLVGGGTRAELGGLADPFDLDSWIFEAGGGVVVEDTVTFFGATLPGSGTPYERIRTTGALERLRAHPSELDHHEPRVPREVSHLFSCDAADPPDLKEVNNTLTRWGLGYLALVDDGILNPDAAQPAHAYHLLPSGAGMAEAIAFHMALRHYMQDECIVIGTSAADLTAVDRVYEVHLVDGAIDDPLLGRPDVFVTSGEGGSGVLEVVETYLGSAG